jgi:hypothetical protein
MKRNLILIPMLAGAMLFTGCVTFPKGSARSGSYDNSSPPSSGPDQALLDAQQEADATNEQSAQDERDASQAAADASRNLTVP